MRKLDGMRVAFALVLPFLVACGWEPTRTWSARSVDWSPEERAVLEGAAADLSAWTGEDVRVVWDDGSAPGKLFRASGLYLGDAGAKRPAILVPPSTSPGALRRVVAHELAHGLGMDHVDDPAALMAGGDSWTEADRAECERAGLARCAPATPR